jgi:hypothetical protein
VGGLKAGRASVIYLDHPRQYHLGSGWGTVCPPHKTHDHNSKWPAWKPSGSSDCSPLTPAIQRFRRRSAPGRRQRTLLFTARSPFLAGQSGFTGMLSLRYVPVNRPIRSVATSSGMMLV